MGKDMYCFNLRFSVPCVINMLKNFQVGILAWDWDPFNIMGDLSWMKVNGLLLLVLVFSFISIEVPLTPSLSPWCVRLRFSGDYFSIPMAISLLASFIFPQTLFWYFYPIIILLSFCSPWILNRLVCLHAMASRVSSCDIIITATTAQSQLAAASLVIEGYPGEDASDSEDGDLEANLADHQVVVVTT